jgi:hypothetical protein
MYKQLRSGSLMIILGNHGRYRLDLNYQGKIAQWRHGQCSCSSDDIQTINFIILIF